MGARATWFSGMVLSLVLAACGGNGGGDSGGNAGGGGGTAPAAPTGFVVVAGDSQATATWDTVSDATSYNLYMASAPGVTKGDYSALANGMKHEGVTSPFVHTTLTNGTTYYFVVTAVNSSGESAESIEFAATPHGSGPGGGDLANWHQRQSGTTQHLHRVAYGNGLFVAVGDNGTILTSPDGATWTARTSGTTDRLHGAAYQNNRFFILSGGSADVFTAPTKGELLTSTNGVTWQSHVLPVGSLHDVVYAAGKYVLVGWEYIATSSDGTTWTVGPEPAPHAYTVAYGSGTAGATFLYAGEDGNIKTSPDGVTWTERLNNGCYISKVLAVNSQFYAVGCVVSPAFQGVGYTSANGLTWSVISGLTSNNFHDLAYGAGTFVAAAPTSLFTSPDGVTWTERVAGSLPAVANYPAVPAVAFGNHTFVVVGPNGTILQSDPIGP